ncbi:MAG: NAD(P)H-hydrate dehydratase [Desulfovibrio sp.]|nr:NAD(P)H-hydrate dehydratase [Desulfovibrio sp.]
MSEASTSDLYSQDFLDTLPSLPSPAEMKAWDQESVRLGVPEAVLMENAARAALAVLKTGIPNLAGKHIALFMGGGNNGGDAACLARQLLDAGAHPMVFCAKNPSSLKGAARLHARAAAACGVPFASLRGWNARWWDAVVDGLVGTGFQGELKEDMLRLVQQINQLPNHPFVLALDVPSGLDARTGKACPEAIVATATATFAAAKPGLAVPEAAQWTGRLVVCDIGLPLRVRRELPASARLIGAKAAAQLPGVKPQAHKNTYGHVLVLGGARGLGGASQMACLGALRAGAGLVTGAAPASSVASVKGPYAEIMVRALETSECWPADTRAVDDLIEQVQAVCIGPGMGTGDDAARFLLRVLAHRKRPALVADADALNLLAKHSAMLSHLRRGDVLTPHPGEAARLLGVSPQEVQADRFEAARKLAELSRAAVVLKGAGTIVALKDAPLLLCPADVPQLACAGSGDLLAGMTAALLASGEPTLDAAAKAVVWHASAGRLVAADFPARGNTAGDIAQAVPRVPAAVARTQAERRPRAMRDVRTEL